MLQGSNCRGQPRRKVFIICGNGLRIDQSLGVGEVSIIVFNEKLNEKGKLREYRTNRTWSYK